MRRLALVPLWISLCWPAFAQPEWLPPQAAEGAARQLAARVGEIGVGRTDETRLAAARQLVGHVRARLDVWKEKGVLERAPRLAELELPGSGVPSLDAMARYQVCNLLLMLQLQDPAFAEDEDAKMTSVTGLTAFTLAVMYLRHPYVGGGGSDEEIEAFLTSPSMEPVFERVQSDPATRRRAESECSAPLQAMMEP